MPNELSPYQRVRLIKNCYQHLGLDIGTKGIIIEKFSDNDFLVDFTSLEDFESGKFGEEILNTAFHADELEPI